MSQMSKNAGIMTADVPKYALIYWSVFLASEDGGCIAEHNHIMCTPYQPCTDEHCLRGNRQLLASNKNQSDP
jgi:hypothetical protein